MKNIDYVGDCIDDSMQSYKSLLANGETPQVARAAMPIAAKLNTFIYQFNLLSLGQALFKQRIWEKGAQGNTVKVVQAMFELVHYMDSELWDTMYEWWGTPANEWVEVRRKLKKSKMTVQQFIALTYENYEGKSEILLEDYLKEIFGQAKSMWD
jgi:hypothetical protein